MTAKLHSTDGAEIEEPDFKTGCVAACVKGVAPCRVDGYSVQCDQFFEQCKSACPQLSDTDSAKNCQESCGSGRYFCKKIGG
jgi:hypothetical protein